MQYSIVELRIVLVLVLVGVIIIHRYTHAHTSCVEPLCKICPCSELQPFAIIAILMYEYLYECINIFINVCISLQVLVCVCLCLCMCVLMCVPLCRSPTAGRLWLRRQDRVSPKSDPFSHTHTLSLSLSE